MSILGSGLGLIRVLCQLGAFELLKPELRQFSPTSLRAVKRSFCRPKHWLTMTQEILGLATSAYQVQCANDLQDLPIVSIKSNSFFKPSWLMALMPLKEANQLRDKMHKELAKLSRDYTQLDAAKSGHFVWVDQPELMAEAITLLLAQYQKLGIE